MFTNKIIIPACLLLCQQELLYMQLNDKVLWSNIGQILVKSLFPIGFIIFLSIKKFETYIIYKYQSKF